MIVLFFDMTSMETDDILRAHAAAQKFLKQQMTPADLVSVVVFSTRLAVLANFTNDRATLDKAIAQLVPGAASQIANPLYAAAQNGEYDVQEYTGAAYTPDETEFNVFNTDQKLAAVEGLANVLAGIPGRKALVEFTGGITQTGEENRAELRAVTDAANRADVSIYSIDARGMFATPPGGDVTVERRDRNFDVQRRIRLPPDRSARGFARHACHALDRHGRQGIFRSRRSERRLPEDPAGQQRILPGRLRSPGRT